MAIVVNRTLVRGRATSTARPVSSATCWAISEAAESFVPVRVNEEFTVDFDDRHGVSIRHYGFVLDDATVPHGGGTLKGSMIDCPGVGKDDRRTTSYELFTAFL
jgi:hypothetical protein